jgi:putative SOS response-associated peptidase YedK
MCGRYSVAPEPNARAIAEIFDATVHETVPVRDDVAPTDVAPVVRLDERGERELALLRWGLVPSWSKDLKVGFANINARGETVASKPAFREAFAKRRCLVVATGFYEWRTDVVERDLFGEVTKTKKSKQHITSTEGPVFAMAGIWERWKDLDTFCIITTDATPSLEAIHDRMPVILPAGTWPLWLDPDAPTTRVQNLLRPYAAVRAENA